MIRIVAYYTLTFNSAVLQFFCSIVGLPVSVALLAYNAQHYQPPSHPAQPSAGISGSVYHDMYSCSMLLGDLPSAAQDDTTSSDNHNVSTTDNNNSTMDNRLRSNTAASVCSTGRSRWKESLMRDRAPTMSRSVDKKPLNGRNVFTCLLLLPRYFYMSYSIPLGVLTGDIWTQSFWLVVFFALFNGYFAFLEYFAQLFRKNHSTFFFAGHFIVFVLGSMVIRTILKRTGMRLDANKRGSTSMYFLGEIAGLLYFYTFYRVLFESIHDWSVFFIFQCIHLVSEWIAYPVRASTSAFVLLKQLQERLGRCHSSLRCCLIPDETDFEDWLEFIALDYGVRFVVMVAAAAAIGFLLLVVTFVPWVDNALADDDDNMHAELTYSLLFIGLALVIELLNALIINRMFFAVRRVDVLKKVLHCFEDIRFAVMVLIFATNLFINPVYVWSKDNGFHYSQ